MADEKKLPKEHAAEENLGEELNLDDMEEVVGGRRGAFGNVPRVPTSKLDSSVKGKI